MTDETTFSKLVSLACHDLRTPLATVYGFARTIARTEGLDEKVAGYAEMIESASQQLAELVDELSLAARIQDGRYEPKLLAVSAGELAAATAVTLGADRVAVSGGDGAMFETDVDAARRSLSSLVRCALRHGGLDEVTVAADGKLIRVSPITAASAPVVLGEDLRDLGAAVAVMHIRALGGSVGVEAETLTIAFA
ncbi:MAG: sensor histidine kinase [Verrucomicrobiota bacterium]